MDNYGGLLSTIDDDIYHYAGAQTMASGFASLANAYIDYNALRVQSGNLNIQADEVELQAQQQANALRKQFIGAIGNATYSAAARGVKVTSANLQQNIERSAGEMDEDIRKAKKSASMKAGSLRTQAKMAKVGAKTALVSGILGSVSDMALGYGIYNSGTKTGQVPVPTSKPKRG